MNEGQGLAVGIDAKDRTAMVGKKGSQLCKVMLVDGVGTGHRRMCSNESHLAAVEHDIHSGGHSCVAHVSDLMRQGRCHEDSCGLSPSMV